MAETIIYLVISGLIALIFIGLGISMYRAEKPVSINTGEKPPRAEELTSVSEWNRRHGRDFVIFGVLLFLTMTVYVYGLTHFVFNTSVQIVIFLIAIFGEVAWLPIDHMRMKREMIKKIE